MKKIIITIFVASILALLLKTSIKAAEIFFDSFFEGYNENEWSVYPGQIPPIPGTLGIRAGSTNNYSSLVLAKSLPPNISISIDSTIFSSDSQNPAADLGIFAGNSNTNQWQNIYLFGIGNGGTPNTAIIRDSLIWGNSNLYQSSNWDSSVGNHHFIIEFSGDNSNPIKIYEDNVEILSYNSQLNVDFNQIILSIYGINSEFYNFKICDFQTCSTPSSTTTPTPTSFPSPTPTEEPTPTPTPSNPKKVILIHGGGGSWNLDALLNCKKSNYNGEWSPWNIGNYDIYDALEERLINDGYDPIRFSYDWRRPVPETTALLQNFISSHLAQNETAYIVAHSLGGLVSRAYLESTHEQSHIEKLLTVGTPHQGLSLAYPAWSGGEIWFDSIEMRLGLELLKATCKIHNSGRISDIIKTVFPSIQNILPIYDYLTAKNGYLTPVSDMHAQNNILPSDFSSPYHDTTLGTLSGRGYETLDTIQIEQPNKSDARKGYWEDGKPTGTNTYADGDGTVLFTSSQIPNATNTTLPLSHSDLITQPTGIDAIIQFLNGTPQVQPLLLRHSESDIHETEKQEALLIVAENAKAILITPNGEKISDTDGQITILDPDHKTYKLILVPKHIGWRTKPYHALVLQLFKNGKTETKEYKSGSWLPKYHTIHFEEGRKHQKQSSH